MTPSFEATSKNSSNTKQQAVITLAEGAERGSFNTRLNELIGQIVSPIRIFDLHFAAGIEEKTDSSGKNNSKA
jgi:hypothetical protein